MDKILENKLNLDRYITPWLLHSSAWENAFFSMIGVKYWFIHWEGGNRIFSIQNKHALKSRHHLTCFKFTSYFIFFVVVCTWTTSEHTLCSSCTENITSSTPTLCPMGLNPSSQTSTSACFQFKSLQLPQLDPLAFEWGQTHAEMEWCCSESNSCLPKLSLHVLAWLCLALFPLQSLSGKGTCIYLCPVTDTHIHSTPSVLCG